MSTTRLKETCQDAASDFLMASWASPFSLLFRGVHVFYKKHVCTYKERERSKTVKYIFFSTSKCPQTKKNVPKLQVGNMSLYGSMHTFPSK